MRVHIIGAGVAGLAAAISAVRQGHQVRLYEAAPQAGGRCRSLDDPTLGRRIDNGSHVLLGANPQALDYVVQIGARHTLIELGAGGYPFVDLETGDAWTFQPGRRVPGIGHARHLRALRLLLPAGRQTVATLMGDDLLMRRLWSPLTVAALNTAPPEASARLFRRTVIQLARHGRSGLKLMMARDGLSETFVDPALAVLRTSGADVQFGNRLSGLARSGNKVSALEFGDQTIPIGASDRVILAVSLQAAASLLPDLTVPSGSNAIVNGHFLVEPNTVPSGSVPVLGLCGATAQWLFQRGDVLSATVSAANELALEDNPSIAERLWQDICRALKLGDHPLPLYRVVKEKRATFDQTPANETKRPGPRSDLSNLYLAGDWTDTGLPATLEGAVQSGRRAARLLTG